MFRCVLGVATLLVLAGCGGAGTATTTTRTGAPPLRSGGTFAAPSFSANWGGYVLRKTARAGSGAFTSATGTWRMPRVTCSAGGSSAAFWVGIGGYGSGSPSLQQLGASADCSPAGVASYRLWTEIVPAPAKFLALAVTPGDTISATVGVSGRTVALALRNMTRGTRYSTRTTFGHALDTSSAEWVAEAPSLCRSATSCQVVPLSDFGSVTFTNASVAVGSHVGRLLDPFWTTQPVVLVTTAGSDRYAAATNPAGAVPGRIAKARRSFAVAFRSHVGGPIPGQPLLGAPLPAWVHCSPFSGMGSSCGAG